MPNTQFVVNPYRFDPYKNFKFRVKWDGKVIAGVSKISALKQSTEPVTHREGGDNNSYRVTPGTWKFEPITLERGITHDNEFENWAQTVWDAGGDALTSLKKFRKNITIELLNENGVVAKSFNLFRCWVSEYQALPELDANDNSVAFEYIVLQYEGWERDKNIPEPTQT